MKYFFVYIALLTALFSCKTDFKVNAPYDRIPIVYGIIDQSVDTQFIKINKSFLGENNPAYPSINDSMYFDEVSAKVEEVDEFGTIKNVYQLSNKMVPVVPGSGIFFTGEQRVFYFVPTTPLNENYDYRIIGTGDGKPFSATTNLIDDFSVSSRFTNTFILNGINLSASVGIYPDIEPKWNQSPDAKIYDVTMKFNYTEYRNGNVYDKFIEWKLGSQKPASFGELSVKTNTESFFIFLSNNADLKDTVGVTKRVIGKSDFRITSANLILKTYIDVNKPNNSISFDKPDYTNIEGGRGIFASRYTAKTGEYVMSKKTIEELYYGSYTSDFKFCTDIASYNSEPYYCP